LVGVFVGAAAVELRRKVSKPLCGIHAPFIIEMKYKY
jgi:hypothetical protein